MNKKVYNLKEWKQYLHYTISLYIKIIKIEQPWLIPIFKNIIKKLKEKFIF